MLLDDWLPSFDVRERHAIHVRAPSERTYASLWETDFTSPPLVRALLTLRALPGALVRGRVQHAATMRRGPVTLRSLERHGFRVLEERAPVEVVLGLEGKFWRLDGGRCTPTAELFRTSPPAPGTARAAWNFSLVATVDGGTHLTTETRVLCADDATRRRFLPYWLVIRLGSGLIRRTMLNAIRRSAERSK